MPNVAVTRLDGSTIDLMALRGKPVVLNWWHTACSPCIVEIPELNKLVEKYEGRDVEFLAIANNEIADLPPFLKRHPFAYDIALGDEEALRISRSDLSASCDYRRRRQSRPRSQWWQFWRH